MKKTIALVKKTIALAIALSTLPVLMFACATAPVQAPVQVKNAVFAKEGDPVYLFHGESKVAKEKFCVGSLVPVYRYDGRHSSLGSTGIIKDQVGKIEIVKDLGDYYAQGTVVEGSVKSGDVAVQSGSGCLIEVSSKL